MTASDETILFIPNGSAVPTAQVPVLRMGTWLGVVANCLAGGNRLSALFAIEADNRHQLFAVLGSPARKQVGVVSTFVSGSYPCLTTDCPSAHWFEREIYGLHGVEPEGHPWLKPVRFVRPHVQGRFRPTIGVTGFFGMEGAEVHEVGVGPVHAGVIEPGHFRFQCHGETVYHLEISLGYQHRGIERALTGGPDGRTIHYLETAAGDSTMAHASTYCRLVEALTGVRPSRHSQIVRALGIELERMANHCGDLGALAGDVGFLPTQNYCSRIRGEILNMTAVICGNRFGRNLTIPGGVRHELNRERCDSLRKRLDAIEADLVSAVPLMFETPSVMARMDGTGIVTRDDAIAVGLVGPAARASGVPVDVRVDLPYGAIDDLEFHVPTCTAGDCAARASIRWMEMRQSIEMVRALLAAAIRDDAAPRANGVEQAVRTLPGNMMAVSLSEGWRGEVCHVAATDGDGRFSFYKMVDPSFHNWFGLALSLRNQQISDFPLCNKSFNLSYCGHDL